jgi:saccharopine dehydrogenase-like NADP-dependent oxidoreductase
MKVAIVGAAGAMAAVAIRDLLEFVNDVSITAADRRDPSFSDQRIRFVSADVSDVEGTARLLEKHDVVLNCVTYYLNVPVMKAALLAGVPYTDLGGLYHGSLKQFELHSEFEKAGIPALLGMGSTPGITNVMAGALARNMDQISELHVRVACKDESAAGALAVPYAMDTVLDEFTLEPMILRNGRPQAVPPMSGAELIAFPDPVGTMEALYTLHSEVAMFPRSFPGLREASFKVAFPPDFTAKVRFLVELGMSSRQKILKDVSPREMLLKLVEMQAAVSDEPRDCDILRIIAKGEKNGKQVEAIAESIIQPHREWKIAAGSLDTGVPLSIGAQMLARKIISQPGVLCPEISVPPELFFTELEKRGMKVKCKQE